MTHDERLVAGDDVIGEYEQRVPEWIKNLERPATPAVTPTFGPLAGIRAVGTGVLIAQPYIGTKLAEFGAEVIHIERAGGDTFRTTAPFITCGPRPHGADEAEVAKNKLSMGLDLKQVKGVELLMALWKISDVWMESSAPGTLERNGICNELALAVNPRLVIVRVSTYGQFGQPEYLGRPGYDALAQAYGGMMNITGDPSGPPQRAKTYTGDYITALTGWAATMITLSKVATTAPPRCDLRAVQPSLKPTATPCRCTPLKASPTATAATKHRASSPTTRSNARTVGCSSASSVR